VGLTLIDPQSTPRFDLAEHDRRSGPRIRDHAKLTGRYPTPTQQRFQWMRHRDDPIKAAEHPDLQIFIKQISTTATRKTVGRRDRGDSSRARRAPPDDICAIPMSMDDIRADRPAQSADRKPLAKIGTPRQDKRVDMHPTRSQWPQEAFRVFSRIDDGNDMDLAAVPCVARRHGLNHTLEAPDTRGGRVVKDYRVVWHSPIKILLRDSNTSTSTINRQKQSISQNQSDLMRCSCTDSPKTDIRVMHDTHICCRGNTSFFSQRADE
jgi:hypothetical protein